MVVLNDCYGLGRLSSRFLLYFHITCEHLDQLIATQMHVRRCRIHPSMLHQLLLLMQPVQCSVRLVDRQPTALRNLSHGGRYGMMVQFVLVNEIDDRVIHQNPIYNFIVLDASF